MPKPCKHCGMNGHSTTFCWVKPKPSIKVRKPLRRIGKVGRQWLKTRAEWFKEHPADYYFCYICGERLTPKETTLDHVLPRSKRPDLRYDFTNLRPCCFRCNRKKGSRVYDSNTRGA